jgi:hypothetical protein
VDTASDTDTTMSNTRDSLNMTDMSYDISEGLDKNAISGKTETIDMCYSSSQDSSSSIHEAQKSKHQKPYLKLVEHIPSPEVKNKYPFEQLIQIPLKLKIMDKPPKQLTNPSPSLCSVSRGTSPITAISAISAIPTVDIKNNNRTPLPAPQYTHYNIKRAKLVKTETTC